VVLLFAKKQHPDSTPNFNRYHLPYLSAGQFTRKAGKYLLRIGIRNLGWMDIDMAELELENLILHFAQTNKAEGKSPKTIAIYEMVLKNFLWFCRHNGFSTEPLKLSTIHIRQFFWYLASETNRWSGKSPRAKKPASKTTVHDYYRALRTFFNWLKAEGLIPENPFSHLKPPKTDKKVITALTPEEIARLF
jgi:site-specific recombinase XerD